MSEAPERNWATGNGQTGSWNDHEINPKHAPHQTEYTRTDHVNELIAAAYEDAASMIETSTTTNYHQAQCVRARTPDDARATLHRIIAAALAAQVERMKK